MSTYNEFIKNFKRVRSYMRNFYIYNFKSREAFQSKSARAYDDERRLLESWQGNHMSFVRPPEWEERLHLHRQLHRLQTPRQVPHGLQEHGGNRGVYLAYGGDYLSDQAHL